MIKLPKQAQSIIDEVKKNGFDAYAIGGSVRDLLMDRPTKGWDFTTNATPEDLLRIFPDSFYDNQFGTVGIKMRDTDETVTDVYEITTYRSEEGYKDHRHPDKISWGKTLAGDLGRRDFTINAIACDGQKIVDPYDGQKDLKDKIIRTVGNPDDRFKEDALRMMRAIRQASELGFMIDPMTLAAIKKNAVLLKEISIERIRDELLKLLASSYAADGILLLKSSGLLTFIIPELIPAFDVQQKSPKRHHIYDVGTHCVMAMKYCPSKDPIIRLATLLHDIGKVHTFKKDDTGLITFYNHEVVGARIARSICYRLKLSKKQIDKVVTLIRWHQFSVDERQTDSAIRRIIRHVEKENLDDMLALRIGDRLGGGAQETSWRLELFKKRLIDVQKQPFSVTDLKINGFDVMKTLGVKPGPVIGKLLNQLFAEVEAGTLQNEREALLSRLKQLIFN
ncbi:MAG TPA: HD domain-containing protein [Patescibacteria group bacterium]|nr:HD domain-containing protein [Patescibacteria group bacterium]